MMLKTAIASLFASLFVGACLMPPQSSQSTSSSTSPSGPGPAADPSPTAASPAPSPAAAPAAASGPQTVSVTIRSSCSKTAKVFYGDKPGFSSGTSSSVSSNSVSSKTFRVGDQMWVVDDGGKPLDNVTIESSTRQIEVTSSCTQLSSR